MKPGWKMVKFGEVVKNANLVERDPKTNRIERIVGLEHIDPENLHIRRWNSVADGTSFTRKFVPGQTLFGKRRAYQRKVAFAEFEGICSGDILTFEPKNRKVLLPELLPFICQSDAFFDHALDTRTSWTALQGFEFPLPPLDEQKRIAEILWAADEARETYSECLVDSLVIESKLSTSTLFPHGIGIRFSGRNEQVPDGWIDTTVGDICEVIDPNPSHRYPPRTKEGVPLLATSDFVGEHGYSFDKCQIVPEGTYEQQNSRCRFQADDIVFARKGILGHARLYGQGKKCFSHTITLIKATPELVLPGYLYHIFRSPHFVRHLEVCMNSNSGVPTLGLQKIRDIRIALPPLVLQTEVIAKFDALLRQRAQTSDHIKHLNQVSRQYVNDAGGAVGV